MLSAKKKMSKRSNLGKRKAIKSLRIAINDDEITSSESDLEKVENASGCYDEKTETTPEKRLHLAKRYLEEVKERCKEKEENKEDLDNKVTKYLKDDCLRQQGKLQNAVAEKYINFGNTSVLKCKHHRNVVTCVCISYDCKFVYSGSKDGSVVKWSLNRKERVNNTSKKLHKNLPCINCITITFDDMFLAVASDLSKIQILHPETLLCVNTLHKHQNKVTGLAFQMGTHQLYSCSEDGSVIVWSLNEMTYTEILYGHQSIITSIDAMRKETAITSGGQDSTIRLWKIADESQLVFNSHGEIIEIVKLINEHHFISGDNNGQICIWNTRKKKPLCSIRNAHGFNEVNNPYWITSLASLQNTDFIASGSQDGFIKLWKLGEHFRTITLAFHIPIQGCVNCLCFTTDGNILVAAVGKEHKWGRWSVIKNATNSILIIPLIKSV